MVQSAKWADVHRSGENLHRPKTDDDLQQYRIRLLSLSRFKKYIPVRLLLFRGTRPPIDTHPP